MLTHQAMTKVIPLSNFSMEFELMNKTDLSAELISRVLNYVVPSERCVLSAVVRENQISALVRFHSPQYTNKPVEYLSSSVLVISLAQVAHLLLEVLVDREEFPYQSQITTKHLAHIRENHELYFIDMRMRFRKKYPQQDYLLSIGLVNSLKSGRTSFHKLVFNVENFINGYFFASVPLIA